jgi:archaemetzincin
MNPDHITLISFGYSGKVLPDEIVLDVEREFSLPVMVRKGYLDLSEFYDASRRQYNANTILYKIDEEFTSDGSKTMAIFSVDLFIPILTYIFGQAFLNGRAGVASIHRLTNELYGMPKNDELLLDRFRKEVIHELGHTFGLIHCLNSTCVMRSSTYVEDIDQKGHQFCTQCRAELKANR